MFSNIKIEGFKPGETAVVTFKYRNYGQTPARVTKALYGVFFVDDPDYGKIRDLPSTDRWSVSVIGAGDTYTQTINIYIPDREDAVSDIVREEAYLVFIGYIYYEDIFGRMRRTLARGYLIGPDIDDGSGRFRVTAKHNRAS